MIGWLVDRVWAHKNRAALAEIDQLQDALAQEGTRLDRRMEETFGPHWQREAEERLARATSIAFRSA